MSTPRRQEQPSIKVEQGVQWLYFGNRKRAFKFQSDDWRLPNGNLLYAVDGPIRNAKPTPQTLLRQVYKVERKAKVQANPTYFAVEEAIKSQVDRQVKPIPGESSQVYYRRRQAKTSIMRDAVGRSLDIVANVTQQSLSNVDNANNHMNNANNRMGAIALAALGSPRRPMQDSTPPPVQDCRSSTHNQEERNANFKIYLQRACEAAQQELGQFGLRAAVEVECKEIQALVYHQRALWVRFFDKLYDLVHQLDGAKKLKVHWDRQQPEVTQETFEHMTQILSYVMQTWKDHHAYFLERLAAHFPSAVKDEYATMLADWIDVRKGLIPTFQPLPVPRHTRCILFVYFRPQLAENAPTREVWMEGFSLIHDISTQETAIFNWIKTNIAGRVGDFGERDALILQDWSWDLLKHKPNMRFVAFNMAGTAMNILKNILDSNRKELDGAREQLESAGKESISLRLDLEQARRDSVQLRQELARSNSTPRPGLLALASTTMKAFFSPTSPGQDQNAPRHTAFQGPGRQGIFAPSQESSVGGPWPSLFSPTSLGQHQNPPPQNLFQGPGRQGIFAPSQESSVGGPWPSLFSPTSLGQHQNPPPQNLFQGPGRQGIFAPSQESSVGGPWPSAPPTGAPVFAWQPSHPSQEETEPLGGAPYIARQPSHPSQEETEPLGGAPYIARQPSQPSQEETEPRGGAPYIARQPSQPSQEDTEPQRGGAPYIAPSQVQPATPTRVSTAPICSICQCPCQSKQHCVKLKPCKHAYHNECITRWLGQNSKCPNCQAEVTDSTTYRFRLVPLTSPHSGVSGARVRSEKHHIEEEKGESPTPEEGPRKRLRT